LFSAFVVLLCSCNNNKPETKTTEVRDSVTTVKNPEKTNDPQEMQTKLEAMMPVDELTLKNKLPIEVAKVTATDVETSSGMGALSASALYQLNDSSSVKIEIIDCGGAAGSGIFSTQYANESGESPDDETTKTLSTFKGQKAIERCNKENTKDCSFTYFDGSRFLVFIEGRNTGIEKLKQIAREIN
jgi:hypothetical protein